MAYRLVYTDFWNDPKVMEEMTPEDIVKEIITNNKSMTKLEKELFCKSKGILGFTQTSKRQLAEDYNMQGKDIDKILRKAQ